MAGDFFDGTLEFVDAMIVQNYFIGLLCRPQRKRIDGAGQHFEGQLPHRRDFLFDDLQIFIEGFHCMRHFSAPGDLGSRLID